MTSLQSALRDCALGLLRSARERKAFEGSSNEVSRLVKNARWHWRHYLQGRTAA